MPEVELLSTEPVSAAAERPVLGSRIGGEIFAGSGTRRSEVFDPATGVATKLLAHADVATVDRAVAVAGAAWREWREAPQNARMAMLLRLNELIGAHRDALVDAIVDEGGKARPDAEGEVNRAIDGLHSVLSLPVSLQGSYGEQVARGIDTYSLPQSLGAVATITPFNFPAMIPLWDAVAALACGNAVIHKPSPRVPSGALLIAELIEQAGIPVGAYNVLQGEAETVNALLDHPGIAAISFVGSTPVARHVFTRGCASGKRVQAMGGAKNHIVVMPDADFDFTAESLTTGAFGASGQRCMSVTLAVAVAEAADVLRERIAARIPTLRVGPGADPTNDMGPLISRESQERVLGLISSGIEHDRADLVVDGRPLAEELQGFFVGPTLFDHVRPGMTIYENEIFGPVLGIVRVASLQEALELIEANPYGNGSSIFTSSGAAARRFQHEVTTGMVGINVPIPVPVNSFSTGGWKASVFGAHGLLGPEAFNFYTHRKAVTTRWPEAGASSAGMAFAPGR